MSLTDELAVLIRQEETLQFPRFDETIAWQLGSHLYEQAADQSWPLVIAIQRFDRPLFFAAQPGVTADNLGWVERKQRTVHRFLRSSYRIRYQLALDKQDIAQRYHLSPAMYASVGGGFPLIVKGAGVIGSVTVSGLPDRQDHQIIVDALCRLLGHDRTGLSLATDCPFRH
ncbi:heme-degrading domain-containing protein [Pseudomonas sp. S31]|uniref:heme-degrading domain-containing protein n=1 Tax=Pseudomonas sp. S31 TaxID=1564473 RepID=UPI0019146BD6|nr:heme-degrading domain-containing protein [Pseudomonas sp. S31]MBK5001330.1 heme-degrading domain-containing protein [Pseudomonas sp. S31]